MTLAGLVLSSAGLVWMSTWSPDVAPPAFAISAATFGLGFGLTVTPRSTAAVEAAGRWAFGAASATVTVARMIGMAVGMAVLTAYGSTTISRLSEQVYGPGGDYKQYIPAYLRDRPLYDGLVVQALETWAANKAASILVGVFLLAAAVTIVAAIPAFALRSRAPMLTPGSAGGESEDGLDYGGPIGL
jgi:hypothetical protein